MDENTIFSGNQAPSAPAPVSTPPVVATPIPAPIGVKAPQILPQESPSIPPAPPTPVSSVPPAQSSPFPLGTILRVVVGIIVLLLLGFITFTFIIPYFFQSKTENVKLSYWGLWEEDHVMQGLLADFHREYPNITIEYTKQDIKQYRERAITRINNGNGPDIFRFHNTWVPELLDSIVPLPTDVIGKDEFQKAYYPVMQKDLTVNGALYGIPINIDTLALFINTDAFKAADVKIPTTWEAFAKVARQLTVKDENNRIKTAGAALGTYENISHNSDIISLLLIQNGADLKHLDSTMKSTTDTLDFYTSFATDENNVWDTTLEPSLLSFTKGNLAMYFGYSWDIFTIKAANPTLQFSIAEVPHLPGKNMTIASYWVDGVSVKSKHQKEAMLFLKYLTRKEVLQKMYTESTKTRLFGELYPRMDMADSLKNNAWVYPFISQAKTASSSFFASDTYDGGLNEKANNYLNVAVGSILASTSVDTAAQALVQGVSQVLEKYGVQ